MDNLDLEMREICVFMLEASYRLSEINLLMSKYNCQFVVYIIQIYKVRAPENESMASHH